MERRKLLLDAEMLHVESFRVTEEDGPRGTVLAHGYTQPDYPSCARTCGASPPAPTALCGRAMATLAECCY
ncbi:MAG TPA: hypothetical protein VEX86_03420 [Longimicrobium sp.]|nr:hypothetical protein [Longimicrobium sp.]